MLAFRYSRMRPLSSEGTFKLCMSSAVFSNRPLTVAISFSGMSHNGYCYDFGIGDYILSPLVHIHCHLALADFKSFLRKGHFYKSCFVVGWSSQKGLADSSGSLVILGDHIEVAATSCSR